MHFRGIPGTASPEISIVTRDWSRPICVVLPLLLYRSLLIGQAVSGSIDGTVIDISGAACRDARVTITDQDRGVIYGAKSDSEGNFSQTHLLAGNYRLKIESAGFATFAANATVQVDTTT